MTPAANWSNPIGQVVFEEANAPVKSAPRRLASVRSAPDRLARLRSASVRLAVVRAAALRFAQESLALTRLADYRSTPRRLVHRPLA